MILKQNINNLYKDSNYEILSVKIDLTSKDYKEEIILKNYDKYN